MHSNLYNLSKDLLIRFADSLFSLCNNPSNLSSPPIFFAKNGPYNEPETELRSLSHYSILFYTAYIICDQPKYKLLANSLLERLCIKLSLDPSRVQRSPFDPRRDQVNGVIGDAWILEALCFHYKYQRSNHARVAIVDILSSYETSESKYYKRIGSSIIDKTFNHQLWFHSFLRQIYTLIPEFSNTYVNLLSDSNFIQPSFYLNSTIKHNHYSYPSSSSLYRLLKHQCKAFALFPKSIAYMPFNLLGFCHLFPSLSANSRSILDSSLSNLSLSNPLKQHFLLSHKCGMTYNPVGFELLVYCHTFNINPLEFNLLISHNISLFDKLIDDPGFPFTSSYNSHFDVLRLVSRIYELYLIFV